jgi:hypothetical protein
MAALTKDRRTPIKAQGTHRHHRRKLGAVEVFKGGIAAINAAGYLVPASDTAALVVVGIFEEHVDNRAGAAGDLEASYITGVEVELENAGGAIGQDDVQAYVADDQSVTTAAVAANDIYVGPVTEFTATKVTVIIDEAVNLSPGQAGIPIDGADAGTVADGDVSPAELVAGVPVLIALDIPDHATQTLSYKTAEKIEIIDAWNIKDGAGAANTLQITDGADAAITNAMAAAVDKTVTHAGTIDKAKRVLAAGATFKVVATRAAGTMAAQLFILAIKRA